MNTSRGLEDNHAHSFMIELLKMIDNLDSYVQIKIVQNVYIIEHDGVLLNKESRFEMFRSLRVKELHFDYFY